MQALKIIFEDYLKKQMKLKEPATLYESMLYILENGGKRIRPLLVLLATKSFGNKIENALPAAAAIEIFHNFTLIHDDIMDHADMRRGKLTIHKKWNENTAILSGDTMLIWAYKMLENYDADIFKKLTILLNKTAIEVCEGQQMDMDFENKNDVSLDEYLKMIYLKTAVLLGTALQFGAIVAQTKEKYILAFNDYGEKIGLAFQIQDDYLDTYGDTAVFGKKVGRDILDRKKTFLYITALQQANEEDRQKLIKLYETDKFDDQELIKKVVDIYNKYNVKKITLNKIQEYTQQALESLSYTGLPIKEIKFWKDFAYNLMDRNK